MAEENIQAVYGHQVSSKSSQKTSRKRRKMHEKVGFNLVNLKMITLKYVDDTTLMCSSKNKKRVEESVFVSRLYGITKRRKKKNIRGKSNTPRIKMISGTQMVWV